MVEELCRCGKKLKWTKEYNRFYCYECQKYPVACPVCRRDLFWVPEYNRYYCNQCASYKEPTPQTQSSSNWMEKHSIGEIESAFRELKASYKNGSMEKTRYRDILEKMRFRDNVGRYWTIGASTSKWYHSTDGSQWVEGVPTQDLEGQIYETGTSKKTKYCAKCGTALQEDDMYCVSCGAMSRKS